MEVRRRHEVEAFEQALAQHREVLAALADEAEEIREWNAKAERAHERLVAAALHEHEQDVQQHRAALAAPGGDHFERVRRWLAKAGLEPFHDSRRGRASVAEPEPPKLPEFEPIAAPSGPTFEHAEPVVYQVEWIPLDYEGPDGEHFAEVGPLIVQRGHAVLTSDEGGTHVVARDAFERDYVRA